MFREPPLPTDQSYKLTSLPVREPPRLAGFGILNHYAAIAAGGYLKWAGRERYGHAGSLMSVRRLLSQSVCHAAHSTVRRPTAVTHSSGKTLTMIRAGEASQPRDHAYRKQAGAVGAFVAYQALLFQPDIAVSRFRGACANVGAALERRGGSLGGCERHEKHRRTGGFRRALQGDVLCGPCASADRVAPEGDNGLGRYRQENTPGTTRYARICAGHSVSYTC